MTDFVPQPPALPHGEPERIEHLDRERQIETARVGWTIRSAQWRARALAEEAFGGDVEVALQPGSPAAAAAGSAPFRGLLHLRVPFDDLERHRYREGLFDAWAARDPVLARVPFLYVFEPRPARSGGGSSR